MYEARIAVLACVFRAIMSPHGVTKAGSRHDPIYKQCSTQRVCSQLSSSAFGEEPWLPMEKHASDAETYAHCTITGQARTPSASAGSRAHAGKMLNGSAPSYRPSGRLNCMHGLPSVTQSAGGAGSAAAGADGESALAFR